MSNDTDYADTLQEAPAPEERRRVELEELMEFKRERIQGDRTPCPSCALLVPIDERRCPHCGSDVSANNALVRETLRHIDEIAAQIDAEHERHLREHGSLSNRFKRLFGAHPTTEVEPAEAQTERVLPDLAAGDALTVIEVDGAWLRVETADGRRGWVYRTPVPRP